MAERKNITHADLMQFTGGLERFRHGLNRHVLYTAGVKFLAERGEAYWIVDAIASYFGSPEMRAGLQRDETLRTLQFWRLDVRSDRSAVLTARADSDVEPLITQEIPFTDFPLEYIDIWAAFDGEYWTLYLPSEH